MTKINKTTVETIKTVAIAVLITGILSFAAGAWTMNHYSDKIVETAHSLQTPTASAAAPAAAEAPASK